MEKVYSEDAATGSLVVEPPVEKVEPAESDEKGQALRILNVAQTYFPYLAEGGRPVKVRILSQKLAQRGNAVTVLTVNLGSEEWLGLGCHS